MPGFEPGTRDLTGRCSAVELHKITDQDPYPDTTRLGYACHHIGHTVLLYLDHS